MNPNEPLPQYLIGGNFLLSETDPMRVYTLEDLSNEDRMIAEPRSKNKYRLDGHRLRQGAIRP